jgi:hypothetical protein
MITRQDRETVTTIVNRLAWYAEDIHSPHVDASIKELLDYIEEAKMLERKQTEERHRVW